MSSKDLDGKVSANELIALPTNPQARPVPRIILGLFDGNEARLPVIHPPINALY